jgi:CRISPR system Cascade subunit CasD
VQDAAFTVAMIEARDAPFTLEEVKEALRKPAFAPFVGRRSCPPSVPAFPLVIDVPSLDGAWAAYDAARAAAPHAETEKGAVYCSVEFVEAGLVDASRVLRRDTRRDFPVTHIPQRFDTRAELAIAS